MRTITDAERRARLARRHGLAAAHRYDSALAAATAMVVLHATEAATVHISVAARVRSATVAEVEAALYEDRSLIKQLAMRRTLFVFPRDLLGAALGSAAARTAAAEERSLARAVERTEIAGDGRAWLGQARQHVLAVVGGQPPPMMSVQQIRAAVPTIDRKVLFAPGTKWGGEVSLAPRVVGWLGARGDLVRGRNDGHWRNHKPLWTPLESWVGEAIAPTDVATGYAEIVRRWLWTFGPGTEDDIVWWLGSTRTDARRALHDVGALPVGLETGSTGWVLPDDLDPEPPVEPWVALLPALDPTTMGMKRREFYLDPEDVPYLVDTAGNAGPTAWVDGRIVGSWVQDEDGAVRTVLRRSVGAEELSRLEDEARRLTEFLDGQVIANVFGPRLRRGLALP